MTLTTHEAHHVATWTAMGTTCRTSFVGWGAADADVDARALVGYLESRWSRFLAGSDVGRLNAAGGQTTAVAPETLAVVSDAITWWRVTSGRFDPTVFAALLAAGYDRDHALGHGPITRSGPAPGCAGIEIDADAGTLRLPPGVGLDLGGIGKGWAVDFVAGSLRHLEGGLVDLGGDLRVWGRPPEGDGWPIAVEDHRDGSTIALLWLADGAVATSSTLRRAWRDGDRAAHHLIDPSSGRPLDGELVTVTVVAGMAAAAEVLAKAALVSGSVDGARALLDEHHVAALLVPADGPPVRVGDFDALCWNPAPEVV